jgi:3-hydroxyisobutyrate dehydrogenase-like beta-hydroxyacid dehydrogenase
MMTTTTSTSTSTTTSTATESAQSIGIVGLGRMGTAIAKNILKSGFKVVVYNRSEEKTVPLTELGATKARTPKEVALKSDIVVSSLRDNDAVLDVVNGEDGILLGLQPNKVHIGTSTISPSLSTKLAGMHEKNGSLYLAAPVLGNPTAAKEAKLTTFVAGDVASIKKCERVFKSYSQRIINLGTEHAKANRLKLATNYVLVVLLELIGQVYSLAEKSSLDLQVMNELIDMIFAYPGLKQYSERIRNLDFDNVGFDLSTAFKDLQLILEMSTEVRSPLPFASTVNDKYIAALANNLEEKDWIATYNITRMLAGL